MNRAEWLEERLREAFHPQHLELVDESAQHAGHPGAASGGSHFRVLLVSELFRNQDQLSRQRAVYSILGDAMGSTIHALALRTLADQ